MPDNQSPTPHSCAPHQGHASRTPPARDDLRGYRSLLSAVATWPRVPLGARVWLLPSREKSLSGCPHCNVEAEVEGANAMGERTHRDHINPGCRNCRDSVEVYASACLNYGAASDQSDAGPQVAGREVVEHDRVDACRDHSLDLIKTINFHLKVRCVPDASTRTANRVAEIESLSSKNRKVVIFRHHCVRETEAVVVSAAAAHSMTFE